MAQRKKKKAPSERKKYCHCSPKCNKKLIRKTRRYHYKNIPNNQRHLIRGSESSSCSDADAADLESPKNQATVPMDRSQGKFDVQELMDSDGRSGAGDDGGDEFREDSEGEDGDFRMGHVSRREEGDDEGDESVSNYSEDLDLDDEIKLGGVSDSENDSEFDDWKAFDEEELEVEHSDEDAQREFEEMMGDEEYAELWSTR